MQYPFKGKFTMNVSLLAKSAAKWLSIEIFVVAIGIYDFFWMLNKKLSGPPYEKQRQTLLIKTEWLTRFLSAKLDDYPEQKEFLTKDLWNGSEPAFNDALSELRVAHFRMLQAIEDPRSSDLVKKLPILPEGQLEVNGLRVVLKRILEIV